MINELPFNFQNEVLRHVEKENRLIWAKSESYFPPTPLYTPAKRPKLPYLAWYAFKQGIYNLRP